MCDMPALLLEDAATSRRDRLRRAVMGVATPEAPAADDAGEQLQAADPVEGEPRTRKRDIIKSAVKGVASAVKPKPKVDGPAPPVGFEWGLQV